MTSHLELLTKKQIMDDYRLPLSLVDEAVRKGELRTVVHNNYLGRYYIPRIQVENLIRRLAGMTEIEDGK